MDILMSIDASSMATGIALFNVRKDNSVKYKKHFLITVPKELEKSNKITKNIIMRKRINFMMKEIIKLIQKYQPNYVLMEDIYAGKDMNTLKMFGRLQGAIEFECLKNSLNDATKAPIIYIAPNSWRSKLKFPNVKRTELKQYSVNYINENLGITVTDDEADAICIGYTFPYL